MTWNERKYHSYRQMTRTIGLNVRGRSNPEIYRVCNDVFGIIEKMLGANHVIGPFNRHPRFEFAEVQFLLYLLGSRAAEAKGADCCDVDLWRSEG